MENNLHSLAWKFVPQTKNRSQSIVREFQGANEKRSRDLLKYPDEITKAPRDKEHPTTTNNNAKHKYTRIRTQQNIAEQKKFKGFPRQSTRAAT